MDKTSSLYVKKRPAFRFGSIIKLILMAGIVGSAVCLYEDMGMTMGVNIRQVIADMKDDLIPTPGGNDSIIWKERRTTHTLIADTIDTVHVSPRCQHLLALPYNPQYPIPEEIPGNMNNPYTYLRIRGRLDNQQHTGIYYLMPEHPPRPDDIPIHTASIDINKEHHDAMADMARFYPHPLDGLITVHTPIHILNYSATLNQQDRSINQRSACEYLTP